MCEVSPRLTRIILFVTALFALVCVLPLASAIIISFTDKFIIYTGLSLLFGILTLIVTVGLFIGGILGILGIRKQNLKCVLSLFFLMILSLFVLLGLAIFTESIYYSYKPKEGLASCAQRFEKQPDLVYLGLTFTQDIVCSTFCPCKYDLDSTIASALTGVDNTNGATKYQECGDAYNSKLEAAANLMGVLEETYKCRGFCQDPTQEHFTYSNSNKQSLPSQCQGAFEKYVEYVTGSLGAIYFGVALLIFLMLVIHCLLLSVNVMNQERMVKSSQNDETLSRLKR